MKIIANTDHSRIEKRQHKNTYYTVFVMDGDKTGYNIFYTLESAFRFASREVSTINGR